MLSGDADLQAKLKAATEAYDGPKEDKAVFEAVVAPLAEAAGLPFTFEEGFTAAASERGLSDEELDAVAGGGDDSGACYVVGGSTGPDAWMCDNPIGGIFSVCIYVGVTLA